MLTLFKLVLVEVLALAAFMLFMAAVISFYGCAGPAPVSEPELPAKSPCPETLFAGMDADPVTPQDLAAMRTARETCATQHPGNECLKKFIRLEHGRYHAVCGPAN